MSKTMTIRTLDDFIALDGEVLHPEQRIEVVGDYPGSPIKEYDGCLGHVRYLEVDDHGRAVVRVKLEGIDGLLPFYPFELLHEEKLRGGMDLL